MPDVEGERSETVNYLDVPWIPLLLACYCQVQAETLSVGSFSSEGLKQLGTDTVFRVKPATAPVIRDGRQVIRAESSGSASVLFRELRVDLEKTPYLNWSWRVNNIIPGLDERTKAGDDYPARIYIVTEDGLFPWQSKAVNYVWAGTLPKETRWMQRFHRQLTDDRGAFRRFRGQYLGPGEAQR